MDRGLTVLSGLRQYVSLDNPENYTTHGSTPHPCNHCMHVTARHLGTSHRYNGNPD